MKNLLIQIQHYTGQQECYTIPKQGDKAPRLLAQDWLREKRWFDATVVTAEETDSEVTV